MSSSAATLAGVGSRCAASTKGSVVLAYDDSESGRKEENEDAEAAAEEVMDGPPRRRVCARYDSRPELKAKEPRGRAESESKRR